MNTPNVNKVFQPYLKKDITLVLAAANDEILGRVRLDSYSMHHLTLMRLPGEMRMPRVTTGQQIRIFGRAKNTGGDFVLTGTVTDATMLYIQISDIRVTDQPDKRMFPRYVIHRSATIYNRDNPRLRTVPQACEIQDISLNGARIVSNYEYHVGLHIHIQAELYDKARNMSFDGQIVRTRELSAAQMEYGVVFAELPQGKKTDLQRQLQLLGKTK